MITEKDFWFEIQATQKGGFSNGIPVLIVDNDKAAEECYKLAKKMSVEFLRWKEVNYFISGKDSEELFNIYLTQQK